MVAQTKAGARSLAGKPETAGRKALQQDAAIDGKTLLDEQASAAAVVDADQAETVAAQLVEGPVQPTDAPADGIGLIAQATGTPTDPPVDTTTTGTMATTPPPEVEAPAGVSPWVVGGAALLGFGAVAAIADNNDDDEDEDNEPPAPPPAEPPPAPPPATEPPPAPPPPPAAGNVPPTTADAAVTAEADGTTALPATTFPFVDTAGDTLSSVRIEGITQQPFTNTPGGALQLDAATGHGYELVTPAAAITWEAARDAAVARGGRLAILDTEAEMQFVQASYENFGSGFPATDGTWVGGSQQTTTGAPGDAWTWLDNTVLPGDSPLWNSAGSPFDANDFGPDTEGVEDGEAQYLAIFNGFSPTDTAILYDVGEPGTPTNGLPRYLIEYDNADSPLTLNGTEVTAGQEIAAADLGGLTWNSLFNTGGTVAFSVADAAGAYSTPANLTFTNPVSVDAGPSLSVAPLIDEQIQSTAA